MGEEGEKPTRVDPETGLTINRYNGASPHNGVANRRVRAVGPHTEQLSRLPQRALRLLREEGGGGEGSGERPKTRGDCVDGPRPCPWAGCRQHLYLEVNPTGNMKAH